MKVVHFNIRYSQGGAGRVGLHLHNRLKNAGFESRLIYGYATGIGDDANAKGDKTSERIGTKYSVLGNYAVHRLLGIDWMLPRADRIDEAVAWADVIHLHAVHHHFLAPLPLFALLARAKKPIVHTAHDRWIATGRCAIIGNCDGWREHCGVCKTDGVKGHLPALLDLSSLWRRQKRAGIEMLKEQMTIVGVSPGLTEDLRSVFPHISVTQVVNGVDPEFEALAYDVRRAPPRVQTGPLSMLVSAENLSIEGKTDHRLVTRILTESDIHLLTMGMHSPFKGPRVENLGYFSDRKSLVRRLSTADCYLFSSKIDVFGLTIVEALFLGVPVVATPSVAAKDVLSAVGGRPANDEEEVIDILRRRDFGRLYGGQAPHEVMMRAKSVFSGEAMLKGYLDVYAKALRQEHDLSGGELRT